VIERGICGSKADSRYSTPCGVDRDIRNDGTKSSPVTLLLRLPVHERTTRKAEWWQDVRGVVRIVRIALRVGVGEWFQEKRALDTALFAASVRAGVASSSTGQTDSCERPDSNGFRLSLWHVLDRDISYTAATTRKGWLCRVHAAVVVSHEAAEVIRVNADLLIHGGV
jgi:hypothetical protein